jgi:hypothetical protein
MGLLRHDLPAVPKDPRLGATPALRSLTQREGGRPGSLQTIDPLEVLDLI